MDESSAAPRKEPELRRGADAEARIEPVPDHAEQDRAEQALADAFEDAVPARAAHSPPMVGLGGSAGGLSALQAFFYATPADTGMVFVVVMHLAPGHDSMLAQILQRSTSMPVEQVGRAAKVAPNRVYVIPPGKTMESSNGHLFCTDITPDRGRRVTVDLFFRTLADTHGPRAAAVVLSGADGDGAVGIKRIKERGGLTIAQDPDEAEHSGMPRSAIATGMVDWVLRVGEMPARLRSYSDLLGRLKLPPEKAPQPVEPGAADAEDEEAALRDVLAYLRAQTGRDFKHYKRATVVRRIGRRMTVNDIADVPAYLAFMRTHPGEAGALLQDLLISVTNFFRDRDAFDALAAMVPQLFANKSAGDELRVWVTACASGEEAYSVAILLAEHARTLEAPPEIQVFATDLNADAIAVAREGVYPGAIAADVSEERLRRFFTKEHRGYRVRSELRESVLFAVHDLLKDAPFSCIDLFTCRNFLIYLDPEAQKRTLATAHFALRPGGRLFLGASESIEGSEHLFDPSDKKQRLYEPRLVGRQRLPSFAEQSTLARSFELQERRRAAPVALAGVGLHRFVPPVTLRPSPKGFGVASWRELHMKMVERLAPPSIIVAQDDEIVHLSESAGRFLRFAGGEPTTNLLAAVDPALSVDLRVALLRARESALPVESVPIAFPAEGEDAAIVVRAGRADDLAPGFLLVTFERVVQGRQGEAVSSGPDSNERRLMQQVDELRWQVRDITEQGLTATQELKASNEELQAMNEELRSATEELETSREELQSINEELTTVNLELKGKVDELARSNGDLHNLMASTAIATVFLDRELRITLFTPSAVQLFNLIAADVGRPLADLAGRLDYPGLIDDAGSVLERLTPVEREVRSGAQWLLARLLPYRGSEDRIAGVVLTFLDITVRRNAEESLRESERQFRSIVSQAAVGVAHTELQGTITLVNPRFAEIVGYPAAALVGTPVLDLVHPDDRATDKAAFARMLVERKPIEIEQRFIRRDGNAVWVSVTVNLTFDASGNPNAAVVVLLDVTQRRRSEEALRPYAERLRLIVENAREYAIVSTDLERRITSWNPGAERLTGWSEAEVIGQRADLIFTAEDRAGGAAEREVEQALAEDRAADERWHLRKDGSRFWGSGVMMAMRDPDAGNTFGLLKIFRDQTQERTAQEALETSRSELAQALVENRRARAEAEAANHAKDRFLAILSHELRTPLTPVVMALRSLERSAELSPTLRGTVEIILRNVRSELTLIDDLLDVTRISSGKLEVARERCDMHEVIRAAAAVCAPDFSAKRQRLHCSLDAEQHVVRGDATRLQQVVWNLLKNAAKFTPLEGEIRVETKNVLGRLAFSVADTGVGIAPEALSFIFDAFAQEGPWVTTEFGGLGLGLAIAKATVEAHHGTLTATSGGRGQGATFAVELPLE